MNHILTDASHGMKFAVIENEFGEAIGVDDTLIKKKLSPQRRTSLK